MSVKLGLNAKAYRSLGTDLSGPWIEMENIKDATLEDSMDETEVTRRKSGGIKEYEPTLRGIAFDFDAPNVAGDAEIEAVRQAYVSRSAIPLQILDGAITEAGSNGIKFMAKVFKRNRNESLADAQMLEFSLKPSCSDFRAEEVTIA